MTNVLKYINSFIVFIIILLIVFYSHTIYPPIITYTHKIVEQ